MTLPFHLLLLIVAVGLIVAAKYFLEPPFSNWAYGAGVFCAVVWLILLLVSVVPV